MDTTQINSRNRIAWDANAEHWDEYMGAGGNNWHKELIAPETERLLRLKAGDWLLDVGCGNGLFARRMAQKGVMVTAFDFSLNNIENAQNYESHNVDYQVLDATSHHDMGSLQARKYKGVVANMVLMDMPDLECLFSHVSELLADGGAFVFSILNPCFNSEFVCHSGDGRLMLEDYMNQSVSKGYAIPAQSEKQYYFHRPISYYMNLGFANKLSVTGFVEPCFGSVEEDELYSKFPPVLIIRMEKSQSQKK